MKIAKSEGNYRVEQMQQMATIASTADGLTIEGNNFKVCALTGSPDMLLFACERINKLEQALCWAKNDWTGSEPSESVMHRYFDELDIS